MHHRFIHHFAGSPRHGHELHGLVVLALATFALAAAARHHRFDV